MKRSAAVRYSLAIALAAASAGAALCAAPVSADETSQVALAPLPQVLAESKLFPKKSALSLAQRDSDADEDKGDKKGHGDDCRDDWRNHRVRLLNLPIGYVIDEGVTFSNLIPNHPAGFPADRYSYWFTPVVGIGGGTEVSVSVMGAEALERPGTATFYGGAIQKRLMRESGGTPAMSLGVYGNHGPNDHDTIGSYLVATKKIMGKPCTTRGAYLTGGVKYERYTTNRFRFSANRPFAGLQQIPFGRVAPENEEHDFAGFGGLNVALSSRLFLSGEISQKQEWEYDHPWAAKATALVYKDWGIQGGVRNDGYRQHGFVGLVMGSIGDLLNRR